MTLGGGTANLPGLVTNNATVGETLPPVLEVWVGEPDFLPAASGEKIYGQHSTLTALVKDVPVFKDLVDTISDWRLF